MEASIFVQNDTIHGVLEDASSSKFLDVCEPFSFGVNNTFKIQKYTVAIKKIPLLFLFKVKINKLQMLTASSTNYMSNNRKDTHIMCKMFTSQINQIYKSH